MQIVLDPNGYWKMKPFLTPDGQYDQQASKEAENLLRTQRGQPLAVVDCNPDECNSLYHTVAVELATTDSDGAPATIKIWLIICPSWSILGDDGMTAAERIRQPSLCRHCGQPQ